MTKSDRVTDLRGQRMDDSPCRKIRSVSVIWMWPALISLPRSSTLTTWKDRSGRRADGWPRLE